MAIPDTLLWRSTFLVRQQAAMHFPSWEIHELFNLLCLKACKLTAVTVRPTTSLDYDIRNGLTRCGSARTRWRSLYVQGDLWLVVNRPGGDSTRKNLSKRKNKIKAFIFEKIEFENLSTYTWLWLISHWTGVNNRHQDILRAKISKDIKIKF